jgi:hypothetical protein
MHAQELTLTARVEFSFDEGRKEAGLSCAHCVVTETSSNLGNPFCHDSLLPRAPCILSDLWIQREYLFIDSKGPDRIKLSLCCSPRDWIPASLPE